MKQKTVTDSLTLTEYIVEGLLDRKGLDIVRMDLRGVPGAITDYFVVATGTSDRHVQALGNSVVDAVREHAGEKPFNTEGMQLGEWVLLDYVNVVVHIFQENKRQFFNIEELWGDAEMEHFGDQA